MKDAGSGGSGSWPVQLAKLTSCDLTPLGLMVSFGSCPAEAVWGRTPVTKMSRRLMVCTSKPVR